MKLRSLLFVPGDSPRKFAKASGIAADVLILDLEDSVAPSQKGEARAHVADLLNDRSPRPWAFFVRVNALDSGLLFDDLAAVVKQGLDGIMVPKADGAADVVRISAALDQLEQDAGLQIGHVKIIVVATETPLALFNLASYSPPPPRLIGLTWGAEDLSAAVGATSNREENGDWTAPYMLARSLCLFAATAAGVAPIETLHANFRDPEGLAWDSQRARRDGFIGRLAIHPDQIETINQCFTPSTADIAEAQMIVDAFAAQPDAGTLGINGKMYDIPHLKVARATLIAAGVALP
jgi:citrate lyase subunit beta / citryl-CoA lyase